MLNPAGMLGNDLFFDRKQADAGECVLEGPAGGRAAQTRFGTIEDSEIILRSSYGGRLAVKAA